MEHIINLSVKNKIAVQTDDTMYICGNSDFITVFDFDDEWDEFDAKTARFVLDNGTYQDVVFEGNRCPVPIISNTWNIKVGVFAGNLRTTTSATVSAKKSVLCGAGSPVAPSDDVYAQIMMMLQGIEIIDRETMASAVNAAVSAAETATEEAEKVEQYLGESTWVGFELSEDGELYAILSKKSDVMFALDADGNLEVEINV